MKSLLVSLILALASTPAYGVAIWGQCGGIGYSGSTTCDSGLSCVKLNDYYSQCLQGASTTSAATSTVQTTTTASTTSSAPTTSGRTCSGTKTKFSYFGVNESGAEFGNANIPGVYGTDYIWPAPSSIDYFVGLGFNTFRVPFLLERLAPPATGITGAFDPLYLGNLTETVNYITGKGAYVLIEPHNYMIYNGATITSTSAFQTFWTNLASLFKSNSHVIFDLMNEPHDIPATTVYSLMQAGVNGVRAAGATSQLILVEGTSWTGAWTWTSSGNAAAFTGLTDPNNHVAIEMHQYLDSDGSGSSATCVSSTIGAERLADATSWLQANNIKGFLGEIGAGNNDVCITAVYGALCAMQEAGGAWLGALWWAAGQWWGDYFQSIEPPSGAAITGILPEALEPFL
ncbi:endoglucanase [Punctularia strigosozonata HHB-11173 SS5]|uniref:endoglucanase n=1 Tax=Punctularia strigosozonata (strain HHB-11173) TaxID=741275 RepID=UPI0004416CA5|nr:endoglucanase [Punctularia strigosozonata HHB-11173 SS5]EIN13297.1 endoglucanase [Punctularia strigosozonata HHB-11173 SS5]